MAENEAKPGPKKAVDHVTGAYKLLKALQSKVDQHPEIGQAIHHLEMALVDLEVSTGGMW